MPVEQRKLSSTTEAAAVRLRKFPHPFRSMLAVSSDIDQTTMNRFRNIHRFLNTLEETPVGLGVGLDIADSLWVFNGTARTGVALHAAYDRSRPRPYRDELLAYAHAGWVDTLHTYGDYSHESESRFQREHAANAIDELQAQGVSLKVWVNHGSHTNAQNFGGNHEAMLGDLPHSRAYHTDLLLEYGVQFAWNHLDGTAPGHESPLTVMPLRDGQKVWGFSRFTGITGSGAAQVIEGHAAFFARHDRPLSTTASGLPATMLWWPGLLDSQLAPERLDALVANSHYCIAAQHLGDLRDSDWFNPATVETFRQLKRYQDCGLILIARTSRLLEYARVSGHVQFETRAEGDYLYVDIASVADPVYGTFVPTLEQIRGLTFYVPNPDATYLRLAGEPIANDELVRSASDLPEPSIGVRWFGPDTTDYVARYGALRGRSAQSPATAMPGRGGRA